MLSKYIKHKKIKKKKKMMGNISFSSVRTNLLVSGLDVSTGNPSTPQKISSSSNDVTIEQLLAGCSFGGNTGFVFNITSTALQIRLACGLANIGDAVTITVLGEKDNNGQVFSVAFAGGTLFPSNQPGLGNASFMLKFVVNQQGGVNCWVYTFY
jgi:hypothetical protein